MNQEFQITIPDFDDDDIKSAPIAFGRFGGFGAESPSLPTPPGGGFDHPERSYFSHSRGDSNTSVDSTHSATRRYAGRPFAHSSQSSITTPTSAFSKKSSFASIRSAFKSGKSNNEPPPVPQVEYQHYPILKNPFNRSTSSLTRTVPATNKAESGSTALPRPPTPGSSDGKGSRSTPKSKHSYARSQHSHSGSIFQASDTGSDQGYPYSSSPPPVPRVPSAFGNVFRSQTPPFMDFDDDKVVLDPKTASDYALHAVFIRFATSSEEKINSFLRLPLDPDPFLPSYIGPGVDKKFDDTLLSLGKIAQKHAKPVIDSILRWRRSQHENVGSDMIKPHLAQLSSTSRAPRALEIPSLLNERKSIASIYIMCRALIASLQFTSSNSLGEALGYSLEETTFDQLRRPDLKLLAHSHNHRINAELYAILLGHIANVRFVSVTYRFLNELGPLSCGQVTKDLDMKYENLVRGLKHIRIKVWPPEAFEEGAEFLEALSKSFAHAHGQRLKIVFAETLNVLLHPIGKTAQAETNNPQWAKAIDFIYPKAKDMMSKPRYWQVAFPLAITSLCVAPQNYFLRHWVACFEVALSKLKEKPWRVTVMNGILRLFWTYLYRCQESAPSTVSRLEILLKHFFPPNKLTVYPADDNSQPFVLIIHFILLRHFEWGRDLCMELMQEQTVMALQKSGNPGSMLTPERTAVAIQAALLTFHAVEKENLTPTWPSSSDFTIPVPSQDYPTSSAIFSPSTLVKPGLQDFYERCGAIIAGIAVYCSNAVGHMSVLDDQWHYVKTSPVHDETPNSITRRHPDDLLISYPAHYSPFITLLQTCFAAWPRCLHPSINITEVVDMLFRGIIHVEPSLGQVATTALNQFLDDPDYCSVVILRFTSFVFSPNRISQETPGVRLVVEMPRLLSLWASAVDKWIQSVLRRNPEGLIEQGKAWLSLCSDIEAAALFLIVHESPLVYSAGVKTIRLLGRLIVHINTNVPGISEALRGTLYITECLHGKFPDRAYLYGYDDHLAANELSCLQHFRKVKKEGMMLLLAESTKDRKLWRYVFPAFIQSCMEKSGLSLTIFRETIVSVTSKYHSYVAQSAGLSNKASGNLASRNPVSLGKDGGPIPVKEKAALNDQWHIWVKVLCATASVADAPRPTFTHVNGRDHSGTQSDSNFERERLSTTRGLFRYLTPFLDSELAIFREAAVLCISSFPSSAYPQLLEDLSLLASRQFYDDVRMKTTLTFNGDLASRQPYDDSKGKAGLAAMQSGRSRRQERLHSAVAQIYNLTAHFLREQRTPGRQAALANVLKFVRNTHTFLSTPEARDSHTLQCLRRYFCGTVERVFEGMSTLKDSDRFVPAQTHLALYRLCEEWCLLGIQSESVKKRALLMRKAVESQGNATKALELFYQETTLLSQAAIGALCALCPKALSSPDSSSTPPTDGSPEMLKLSSGELLDRLSAIIASNHIPTHSRGRKALRSLLISESVDTDLKKAALLKAALIVNTPAPLNTCHGRFFETITQLVCDNVHNFTFSQITCLGLSNLRHPSVAIRQMAFNLLESIHQQSSGLLTMSTFEASIGSSASTTYIHAHRLISDFLAGEHPQQAPSMLAQIASWLSALPREVASTNLIPLVLQSLEYWISNIDLTVDDQSRLSQEGLLSLYHLVMLTLNHGQSHTEQILVIWTKLVEPPQQCNGHACITFLVQFCTNVSSTVFNCAANIVSALCQTHIGRQIFEDLCSMIELARMSHDQRLPVLTPELSDLWSGLKAVHPNEPKLNLYPAQSAWLLLSDAALQRYWENRAQLPVLLHMLFTHLDSRTPFVRQRAQFMLFQLLRSWTPGYDELPDRSTNRGHAVLKDSLSQFEKEARDEFWKEDDFGKEAEPKMRWLSSHTLKYLEPLAPLLSSQWGSLALSWGTACSNRSVAFRSLQIFRAIIPRIKQADFALLLGRLSCTISASEEDMQLFTCEIISTLKAAIMTNDNDQLLFPLTFWSACACLSSGVESDFSQALTLLGTLLDKIDLDDPVIAESILTHQPGDWRGSPYLQPALLKGLRSSTTANVTMYILRRLVKVRDSRFIDASDGRLRDIYTVSLPWCLHAMDQQDNSMCEFAGDIGFLAEQEGKQSIHRIMTSFSKSHFRTRDDFLRQSVASLREHYGVNHWTNIVTLLMGLVLNSEKWLRIQTLQILKVLFQQRDTRSPVELLGPELLMPLLRLLETDLASHAIDVLEEPVNMSGGLAAKHILRLSMHAPALLDNRDMESVTTVFGVSEESGWCVAQADVVRENCRANVMAVFDTCSMPTRPSRIDFEPEVESLAWMDTPFDKDLGGLVKDLHDLTSFFQDKQSSHSNGLSLLPSRRLEARVAAILAKSTASEALLDMPQTPFLDVFRVSGSEASDQSDEHSNNDSDSDVFAFDTLSPRRFSK